MELLWAWFCRHLPPLKDTRAGHLRQELPAIRRAITYARNRDVTAELAQLRDTVPAGSRIAVIGCGGTLPPGFPAAHLFDFDEELLRGCRRTRHTPSTTASASVPCCPMTRSTSCW